MQNRFHGVLRKNIYTEFMQLHFSPFQGQAMLIEASKCSSQMASFYLPQQSLQAFFWLKSYTICIVLLKISFIFTSNLRFCCFSIFLYWKRNSISHRNKNFLKFLHTYTKIDFINYIGQVPREKISPLVPCMDLSLLGDMRIHTQTKPVLHFMWVFCIKLGQLVHFYMRKNKRRKIKGRKKAGSSNTAWSFSRVNRLNSKSCRISNLCNFSWNTDPNSKRGILPRKSVSAQSS